ncbi:MAG: cytidine deaminase [Acetobacteraceae bacterium]
MAAEGALAHLLSASDRALVEAAVEAVRARYRYGRHTVGAAVRGASGRLFTAVNLDATVGRAAVCAEAVALGAAVMAGESGIEAVVAVRHPRPDEPGPVAVVSPCGACRELLLDHAGGCAVIMPGRGRVPIRDLLPGPYRR